MAIAFASPGFLTASQHDMSAAQRKLDSAADRVNELQAQLDRLLLITESMWFVLKDRLGLDDATLMNMMKQVDSKDGKLDGTATPQPEICPNCNHTISARTGRCFYCGTTSTKAKLF